MFLDTSCFFFYYSRYLYSVLHKNQTVTDGNRSLLVETLRSIAEILIWGDQNDSSVFEWVCCCCCCCCCCSLSRALFHPPRRGRGRPCVTLAVTPHAPHHMQHTTLYLRNSKVLWFLRFLLSFLFFAIEPTSFRVRPPACRRPTRRFSSSLSSSSPKCKKFKNLRITWKKDIRFGGYTTTNISIHNRN